MSPVLRPRPWISRQTARKAGQARLLVCSVDRQQRRRVAGPRREGRAEATCTGALGDRLLIEPDMYAARDL